MSAMGALHQLVGYAASCTMGSEQPCGGATKDLVLHVPECRLSQKGQSGLAPATNGCIPPFPQELAGGLELPFDLISGFANAFPEPTIRSACVGLHGADSPCG